MPIINKQPIKYKHIPYNHTNNISGRFYNTTQWHNLRNYYIRNNPLCELCLNNNKIVPATEVHHKRPFLTGKDDIDRWKLLLDEDNLMSLCSDCHHKLHNQMRIKSK